MAIIRLEFNVPIPPIAHKKHKRRDKYPVGRMQIGDSFLVPKATLKNLAPTLHKRARDLNIKLTMRTLPEGVRVWRTA